MEQLLHYVWKHKLFPLTPLTTTWHQAVEVIDPGLHNRNAGPDFFNAKIKLNGTLWVGNVEIHDKASDWYVHGHDKDERYDNVILHVCGTIDVEAKNSKGEPLVQLQLDIPENVSKHYQELLSIDQYPPCYQIIPSLTRLTVHSWMSALQTERLSQKTDAIEARVKQCNGDWENAYFVTLARNYGFGINGDAFEQWAYHLPLRAVDHHRDDLFQIEAIFLGEGKISHYDDLFRKYSKDIGWDWRMLASLAYTESNFDTTAVSWAGAKGLMQLMPATARAMGVPPGKEQNPEESVKAAIKYIAATDRSFSMIPDKQERLNFILASYNAGLGHIYDAMALAEKYGKNKLVWKDNVENFILLKSNEEYFTDPVCKNGYFRGIETYNFVRDIMSRYESYKKKIKA